MRLKITSALLFIAAIVACGEKKPKGTIEVYSKQFEWKAKYNDSVTSDTCFKPANENDSPPFKYPCPCNLFEFGEHLTKDGTMHVYIRGTGWNWCMPSCNHDFYENVYNMKIGDTTFKLLKVHLLDVEQFTVPTDDTEYGTNDVSDKIMLVYERYNEGKGGDMVIVDPVKTGKYRQH